MPAAPHRYLVVVPRPHVPLPTAPLVERRRYLIELPRQIPVAPRRYLAVVPRPMPAAPRRYLILVPSPQPAAPIAVRRSYLIAAPGRCPRRRSLCVVRVAGSQLWCPGRCHEHTNYTNFKLENEQSRRRGNSHRPRAGKHVLPMLICSDGNYNNANPFRNGRGRNQSAASTIQPLSIPEPHAGHIPRSIFMWG
jgi:hypothetical protein